MNYTRIATSRSTVPIILDVEDLKQSRCKCIQQHFRVTVEIQIYMLLTCKISCLIIYLIACSMCDQLSLPCTDDATVIRYFGTIFISDRSKLWYGHKRWQ